MSYLKLWKNHRLRKSCWCERNVTWNWMVVNTMVVFHLKELLCTASYFYYLRKVFQKKGPLVETAFQILGFVINFKLMNTIFIVRGFCSRSQNYSCILHLLVCTTSNYDSQAKILLELLYKIVWCGANQKM